MRSQRVGQDLATKQQQQGRIKWYKEEECFDTEKHVPRLIVAMTTIFLQPSKTGTSTACRGKKSCPSARTSVPSYPCSLVITLLTFPKPMGLCLCSFPPHRAIRHSPPSTVSSQCLTQICGQESQLLQAFLSILCLNWKLPEDRCFPSFTKQDMHLVNVRRTE